MHHTPDDVLGWKWTSMIHPDDLDRVLQQWREAIALGKPLDLEMRGRDADGTYRWLLTRAVPLRDQAGAVVRWYGTITDIDDRKRAEQELRAAAHRGLVLLATAGVLVGGWLAAKGTRRA